jgi:hypothetical protein
MTTEQTKQQLDEQTNLVRQSLWVSLLALLSYAGWRLSRYLNRLLRQPRLAYHLLRGDHTSSDEIRAQGLLIATSNVRSGIEKRTADQRRRKVGPVCRHP